MLQQQLIPHLFRTEFSKIAATLCRKFGVEHLQLAEDITAETFLTALETWPYKGMPANPVAWLYTVAGNKASNQFNRRQLFSNKIAPELKHEQPGHTSIDISFENIADGQLQMLFAVCHPAISTASQIALALRILCGLGIDEIAAALLSNRETIHKRLQRAKEKLKTANITLELPSPNEINNRIAAVLTTLYLLFNEGYYSESTDEVVRRELCIEAMRLVYMLVENEHTNQPAVNALLALMCFHASRLNARQNNHGELILYDDQDETLWDMALIGKGAYFLQQASHGNFISTYHLEANIAYWHTIKEDTQHKWQNILSLYDHLLAVQYSPIAALNRAYALSKVAGKEIAISVAEKLQLTGNHYYFVLLGELYTGIKNDLALTHFSKALAMAKTTADKKVIQQRIQLLQ